MKHQSFFMRSASAMAVTAAFGAAALAAAPEAGSVIGNQAVATYTNQAGDTITVTSNTVETIVQQVAGVTLTSDNNETIAPGGKAFLPHIVTNEGNGADFFALTAVETDTGTLDTSAIVFYPDANMDGVADSATPLTETPTLAPGEQFGVVIEVSVPSNATGSDSITVTARSDLDGTETAVNTDTLTISNDAIVELVKSMLGGERATFSAEDIRRIEMAVAGLSNLPRTGRTVSALREWSCAQLIVHFARERRLERLLARRQRPVVVVGSRRVPVLLLAVVDHVADDGFLPRGEIEDNA